MYLGIPNGRVRSLARRTSAVALSVTCCLTAGGAAAQSGKGAYVGSWSVGGALGYAIPNTDEYDNAAAWRLVAGYSPMPQVEFDFEVGKFSSGVDQPEEGGLSTHTIASGDLDVQPVCLTVQYRHPLPEALSTLVVLAGVGYYLVDYSMSEEARAKLDAATGGGATQSVDDAWGFHLGAGLEYALTERVSLAAEGRYLFLSPEYRGTGASGTAIDGTIDLNTWVFSGGIKVAF